MGRTILSENGRFEWDEDKSRRNRKKYGFSFDEILEIFDDPAFLEGYKWEHSGKEDRYYGIGRLNNILYIIAFYTYRKKNTLNGEKNLWLHDSRPPPYIFERVRIISARQVDSDEQEEYHDYFKKIKS
jgi:uncharacterized DUF497 family protein